MTLGNTQEQREGVRVLNPNGRASVVLVCEHASHHMPAEFDHLGLPAAQRQSHAAWDPGALGVATELSKRLDAVLVAGTVSRLVYDCNRPPDAPDAMPARSEVIDIPGNTNLTGAAKADRVARFYTPFRDALGQVMARMPDPILVTVHSFTPVFNGQTRTVELGILHDADSRLADALLGRAGFHTSANVQRNAPYGPEHGVTHTLRQHALPGRHLNAMIEIRNDLIATTAAQAAMGDCLAGWITDAVARIGAPGDAA